MGRTYTLTEQDHRQLQEMLRWYDRNKNLHPQFRRRNIGAGGGGGLLIRRAKTTQAAPADTKITANLLDNKGVETSTEIDVYCDIAPSGNLNKAIPRLPDDFELTVYSLQGKWFCPAIFQAIDETKGLDIESGKLAVQIDSDELRFSGGEIQTKIDECPQDKGCQEQ